jgi:hypothetical protein
MTKRLQSIGAIVALALALTGCPAKKKPIARLVIPPECITRMEPAGDCEIGKTVSCPAKVTYNCTKAVQAK